MTMICFVTDAKGDLVEVVSDTPIRVFSVDDQCESDRVYEFSPDLNVLKIGAEHVRRVLRDDPVGHYYDGLDTEQSQSTSPTQTPSANAFGAEAEGPNVGRSCEFKEVVDVEGWTSLYRYIESIGNVPPGLLLGPFFRGWAEANAPELLGGPAIEEDLEGGE